MSKKTKRRNKRRRKSRKNMCGGAAPVLYTPPPPEEWDRITEHYNALRGTELENMFRNGGPRPRPPAFRDPFSEDMYIMPTTLRFPFSEAVYITPGIWGRSRWLYEFLVNEYEIAWQQLINVLNTPGGWEGVAEERGNITILEDWERTILILRQRLRVYRNGILYWIYRYSHLYPELREYIQNIEQHLLTLHHDIM